MQLKPVYTVRFRYHADWEVGLTAKGARDERHFYLAEGDRTGALGGRFGARIIRAAPT